MTTPDIRTMTASKLAVRILALIELRDTFSRASNARLLTDQEHDEWDRVCVELEDAQNESKERAASIANLTDEASC
jgi:hypothetical protein